MLRVLFRYNNKLILIPSSKQRRYSGEMHFPGIDYFALGKLNESTNASTNKFAGTISPLPTTGFEVISNN